MFFDDHKKKAMTLIGRRSEKGERMHDAMPVKPEVVKTEDGAIDGRHAAMEDFMAAHREGSAMKMADAMKNFIDIHHAMNESEQEHSSS